MYNDWKFPPIPYWSSSTYIILGCVISAGYATFSQLNIWDFSSQGSLQSNYFTSSGRRYQIHGVKVPLTLAIAIFLTNFLKIHYTVFHCLLHETSLLKNPHWSGPLPQHSEMIKLADLCCSAFFQLPYYLTELINEQVSNSETVSLIAAFSS